MAAQVEEVLLRPDRPVEAEEILPDPGDHLLDRARGRRPRHGSRLARRLAPRQDLLGRRQRPPVDLAVRGERQRREAHEGRRHHVLRQALAEVGAQLARARRGSGVRILRYRVVGDQPVAAAALGERRDERLAHRGVAEERALDLPRLDAEAAHLDLQVAPAEELERPVVAPARQVAGAIEASA